MSSFGFILFMVACFVALKIEQKAGYYECQECGYKYVPTYKQVLMAPHINRSRLMKRPHCGKKTYQKKVVSKKHKYLIDIDLVWMYDGKHQVKKTNKVFYSLTLTKEIIKTKGLKI